MAWLAVTDEHNATGDLKVAYDSIAERRGRLSNIMRIHSARPDAMLRHMDLYVEIMFGRGGIRRADRELIATVVSAANSCDYCVRHHSEALNHYWKDEAKIATVVAERENAAFLDDRQKALLTYAVRLTTTPEAVAETDVLLLRSHGLEDTDILLLNLIVSYFNFVNRIAVGLGVDLSPDEVGGYKY